jgi:colanic acid/amylovoran biosynthesis glycosyltransferase
MNTYLGASCTFIYTALRFQKGTRPVVLARRTAHAAAFPLDTVIRLLPQGRVYRRFARSFPSRAARFYDRRLVHAARLHRCAVLHAHFGWAASDALGAREKLGLPLVTTFYGNDLAPSYPELYPYERLFDDGALFFCEGPAMASRLFAMGCPRDKVRIVKIGLDLADFPFSPPRRSRPLVVVQAARFVDKKGVDLSIRAFAAARRRLGESELWLIGDGGARSDLEQLARTLRVERFVRFLGMLAHGDLRARMRRAHICLQPSRTAIDGDTEGGAPTTLLEMQAIGIPVVSTRHADIPSVVAHPNELVEEEDIDGLADGLVRLAELPDEDWQRRAERGRALIEAGHDAERVAERVERLYRDALGGGSGGGATLAPPAAPAGRLASRRTGPSARSAEATGT